MSDRSLTDPRYPGYSSCSAPARYRVTKRRGGCGGGGHVKHKKIQKRKMSVNSSLKGVQNISQSKSIHK